MPGERMRGEVQPPYSTKKGLALGEMCVEARQEKGKAAFSRWRDDVSRRFEVSIPTLYRWMSRAYVLMEVVPSKTARAALRAVTGGSGLFTPRKDGKDNPTRAFLSALKDFPVPPEGASCERCRDWALNIQVKIEQSGRGQPVGEAIYESTVPGFRLAPRLSSMSNRRGTIHAVIQRDESVYFAECLEVAVVTQGKTLDEVVENLREALALHLEDEDMAALGLAEHPRVQLVYDTAIAS